MTSERGRRAAAGLVGTLLLAGAPAAGAEAPYPFEGTWVRVEHACSATTVRARTYTAREVVSPRGRCLIRRVATGSNSFELLEECRNDHPQTVTETIRMTGPDSLTSKRQQSRLKIPRQIRYVRCALASPGAAHSTKGPQGSEAHPASEARPDAKP